MQQHKTAGIASIGILGLGRFGRLVAQLLGSDFEVRAFDPTLVDTAITADPWWCTEEEVGAADLVIPCVPINTFETCLVRLAPLLRPGTLVMDVCSVKEYPLELLRSLLPREVSFLTSHPLFGPDSASKGLSGCKMVFCEHRTDPERYQCISAYLVSRGIEVLETTAAEHDREVARSQLLTHFIGRGLRDLGATPLPVDTEGYRRLLHILEVVGHDTWELYRDMNRYNRFSTQVRQDFLNSLYSVDKRLRDHA